MSSAPSVDPDRIDQIYQDLASMHVELDPDPLALGPKRLNSKVAECRAYLSKTERIFLEVSQDLHWYKREHRRAQAEFQLRIQELMANDPEVRAGRSVADREAVAFTRLRSERESIDKLVFAVEDLEAVLVIVKTKRADLRDVSGRLRDQLKICQEEIGLGSRWGSSRPTKTAVKPGSAKVSQPELDSVDSLLDEALSSQEDGSEDLPQEGGGELDIESVPTLSPDQVADLKGDGAVDIDDILDGIEPESAPAPSQASPVFSDASVDDLLGSF